MLLLICRYRQAEEHHDYIMDMVSLNMCSTPIAIVVGVVGLGLELIGYNWVTGLSD